MLLPYLAGFGVLLHVFLWGAGFAAMAMPRPWKRFWPILAAPAGLALQSLTVWAGAHTRLPGTESYAWPSELIPLFLLILAFRKRWVAAGRECFRLAGVGMVAAFCLTALVRPLALAASGLTTASLGNCDAADYAAGARVLKEFARTDRTGFLGLTEVVRVLSVDNFFDFWLKLNHFAPSALIAFNGTIFNCVPYELTGLAAMVFFVASLPVVFWIARALFGYRPAVSLGITALFGFSPIMWYAVFQVAIGQLLAAPAIALVTWAGTELWRRRPTTRQARRFVPLLALAYSLVLASYNFIVVVCFVPALAYAAASAAWRRQWQRLGLWLFWMILPLAVAGAAYWERVGGLAERFRLFRTYDFGWRIPALSPEGWLGMVGGTSLAAIGEPWRVLAALAVILALLEALRRGAARADDRAFLFLCFTVPVFVGYAYLIWRGGRLGTNASYDAYKLFSVFYPVLLPALCYWATLLVNGSVRMRSALALLALAIAAGNLQAAFSFGRAEKSPPLIVDRDLIAVGRVESLIGVSSLNVRIPDMWPRLWANGFLLRLPQYFSTHTYEGRRNTPLRGEWDLNGGGTAVVLPDGGSLRLNSEYSLVKNASPYSLRASFGEGWYETERLPRTSLRWRWSASRSSLRLENPQARPLRVVLHFDARSLDSREIEAWLGDHLIGAAKIGRDRSVAIFPEIAVPTGMTQIELKSDRPPAFAPGDSRPLGVAVYGVEIEVLRDSLHP